MKPGALTQAARSAEARREAAPPRHEPRQSRPRRRVSGPVGGKDAARRGRSGGVTRAATTTRAASTTRAATTARAKPRVATSRTTRTPRTSPAAFYASGAPRVVAAARAAAVALPLPLPGFRRAPGPLVRPRPRPVPAPRERESQPGGLARRAGALVVSLPDHPWLDRVVRGRVWIPLLGVLLAGIVAAQVEILKLGANMGRSLEQTTTLTNANEQLRGSVAALGDDQRIERLGAAMGLVLPPPGAVGYLAAGQGDNVDAALANLHAPNSSAFVTMPAKNGALVTGPNHSTLPPSPGGPPPPTTTTSSATTSSSSTGSATSTPSSTGTTTSSTATTSSPSTTTSQTGATTAQTSATSQTSTTTPTTSSPPTQTSTDGAAAIAPSTTQSSSGG